MIYIKNNKIVVPVSSVVSRVVTPNGECVGKLYYRPTKTRRRVSSGENKWDLFKFEPVSDEYIGITSETGGICLGRYGGVDIRLDVHKVISPKKTTPMGFETPLVSESVGSVSLLPEFPTFKECRKCLAVLPFYQPGGAGSELENVNFRDFVIDAQISYLASSCGDAMAEAYDPTKPKPDMLLELGERGYLNINELGTFVPVQNWDGTVPDDRVFSIRLTSDSDHVESGRKFCERFGVSPAPGKTVWADVKLNSYEYEAEIFCSNDPGQMSGVTLFVKDAAAAASVQDVLNSLKIETNYDWAVNDYISFDFLPFSVPRRHGEYRESVEV